MTSKTIKDCKNEIDLAGTHDNIQKIIKNPDISGTNKFFIVQEQNLREHILKTYEQNKWIKTGGIPLKPKEMKKIK